MCTNHTCTCILLDINECMENNGNCSQLCNNSIGSYQCDCEGRYTLDTDQLTCNGMGFPCWLIRSLMLIPFESMVHYNPQSFLQKSLVYCRMCTNHNDVNPALELDSQLPAPDPTCGMCIIITCVLLDINECMENNGNCSQLCNNTLGSYQCDCEGGYTLDTDQLTCNGMGFPLLVNTYFGYATHGIEKSLYVQLYR